MMASIYRLSDYTIAPADQMKQLDLTLPTPAENIALDEELLDAAERDAGGEVLRFWESPEHFVVVGYANKIATEVNVAACEQRGILILRRCSGGGTVVQGPGCLSYALVLSLANRPELRNITAANRYIMERNRAAIETLLERGCVQSTSRSKPDNSNAPVNHDTLRLGLRPQPRSVQVQGHTDLTLNGLKFSGNAQRRRRRFILFHGTFLLNFDLALVNELLPLPSRQPDYRRSRGHMSFLKNLNLPADLVKSALWGAWSSSP